MSNDIRFRKMDLNEEVTITLPAHIWAGFIFTYNNADWTELCASKIALAAQNAILDPVYLREQEAAAQSQVDMQHAAFMHMTGQPMDIPPNIMDGIPPQPGDD